MRCGRYAAIDIGTVTCRMLVVDVDESGLHELTREYAITNLGEGVDATGELKPEAIGRVVHAIDEFLAVRDSFSTPDHPVIRTVAVATSAARDARNAADFAARLRERGIELSVIPGSREAALSFSGASIDFSGERLMVVDVGGGSTEVVMGTGGAEPLCAHSFNVGCRRVTEKFLASDPPAPEELARARAWIREQMASWFADQAKEAASLERVVAVAGRRQPSSASASTWRPTTPRAFTRRGFLGRICSKCTSTWPLCHFLSECRWWGSTPSARP